MRRFPRLTLWTIGTWLVLSFWSGVVRAELPFLLDLPATRANSASIRYTPGSLDRASHVQARLGFLVHDFGRWTGYKLPLHAYLLSRREWEAIGVRIPYGLPVRLPDGGLVLSAWGDAQMVALWRDLLDGDLPALEGTPLRGTSEEASSLLGLDLLAQVEAARTLVARAGFAAAEPKIHDLLAHTLAAGAFGRHEAARLDDIVTVFERLETAVIEDNSPNSELRLLLRVQARTFRAASRLLAARGEDGVKALFKLAKKKDGALDAPTLRKKFPEITDWLERR
ncbi:MAG: hypothetical protein OES47_03240 [Acidobacteriota bacterium]|nr:hypothetical protein [Acidobacteriota bacterium]